MCCNEVDSYNFLDFMKKWTNLVDHGGIIKVNDQFFLFIKYVETLVRKTFTFSFMKVFIYIFIYKQLTDHLLHEVLSKWIDIRANTFVKTFVLIFKRKMNNMLNDKKKKQLR